MTEDEFRLTPADVRAQEFGRGMFGYDVTGVEDFRARVAEELERLIKERSALDAQLQKAREQLKELRAREKTINDAVLLAQQLRQETEQATKRKTELALKETSTKVEEMLAQARAQEAAVRRDIEAAQHQFSGYLAAFRRLLERQLAEVDALERHERDGSAPEAP